jgi:hypothetical protein
MQNMGRLPFEGSRLFLFGALPNRPVARLFRYIDERAGERASGHADRCRPHRFMTHRGA